MSQAVQECDELDVPKMSLDDLDVQDKAHEWILENFPYEILPSFNPGQGDTILEWLEETVGPIDKNWTIAGFYVRFRYESDYIAFGLTWKR